MCVCVCVCVCVSLSVRVWLLLTFHPLLENRYNGMWRFVTQQICFLASYLIFLETEQLITVEQLEQMLGGRVNHVKTHTHTNQKKKKEKKKKRKRRRRRRRRRRSWSCEKIARWLCVCVCVCVYVRVCVCFLGRKLEEKMQNRGKKEKKIKKGGK